MHLVRQARYICALIYLLYSVISENKKYVFRFLDGWVVEEAFCEFSAAGEHHVNVIVRRIRHNYFCLITETL